MTQRLLRQWILLPVILFLGMMGAFPALADETTPDQIVSETVADAQSTATTGDTATQPDVMDAQPAATTDDTTTQPDATGDTTEPDGSDTTPTDDGDTSVTDNPDITGSGTDGESDTSDELLVGLVNPGANEEVTPALVYITNAEALASIPAVTVSATNLNDLYNTMIAYRTVEATAVSDDGELSLTLRVDWDLNALTTDFSTPGNYTESAEIVLPTGAYLFADGQPTSVSIPVIVVEAVEEEPAIITSVSDTTGFMAYAIAQGRDWDSFFDDIFGENIRYNMVPATTADGKTIYMHILWSNPNADTSKIGVVTINGTLIVPDGAALAEGVELADVVVPVSIQAPSAPSLDGYYLGSGSLILPWVIDEDLLATAHVLLREKGGEWAEDGSRWVALDGGVYLHLGSLDENTTYEVKAVWDGGETNIFYFTYNGNVINSGSIGGDRDGGDSRSSSRNHSSSGSSHTATTNTENNTSTDNTSSNDNPQDSTEVVVTPNNPSEAAGDTPTETTPAGSGTTTATGASEAQTVVAEARTVVTTVIDRLFSIQSPAMAAAENEATYEDTSDTAESRVSGERLTLMQENGAVRFSKEGITVSLSNEAVAALNLSDDSSFVIDILPIDNGLTFTVTLDGQSITDLPDTTIQLPYTPKNADSLLQIIDADGNVVAEGTYDEALGIVTFTVDTAGTYTIVESGAALAAPLEDGDTGETSSGISQPLLLAGAVLLLLLVYIWRRRQ